MQKKKERDVYSVKCEREQIDSKSSMAMDCLAVLHSKLFLFGQLIWRCCAQLFLFGQDLTVLHSRSLFERCLLNWFGSVLFGLSKRRNFALTLTLDITREEKV